MRAVPSTGLTFTANTNGTGGTVGGAITANSGVLNGGTFATQVNGTAGSTVTVGNQTYTFVTALGTGAGATTNEIVGGTAATGTDEPGGCDQQYCPQYRQI